MKTIVTRLMLIFALFCGFSVNHKTNAQDSTATLDETISWLIPKIKTHAFASFTEATEKVNNSTFQHKYSYKVLDVRFDAPVLIIQAELIHKIVAHNSGEPDVDVTVYKANEKWEIDLSTVKSVSYNDEQDQFFRLYSGHSLGSGGNSVAYALDFHRGNRVSWEYTIDSEKHRSFEGGDLLERRRLTTKQKTEEMSYPPIYIKDKEMVARVRDALNHAIKLCRKKEPF